MTVIERIAYRLGFARATPPEIIIFPSAEHAMEQGFRGARHPSLPHVRAWWPGAGVAGILGRPIQRVTISRDMRFHSTAEGKVVDLLRARQRAFGDLAMWIEL
ncbi:hypothetical protein [Sphingomonas sp. CFBP 8760]|uniref:hypothetical protein n=1 Tax=Sphingomonas sp. CFBP 8760 TaxID=2775282 RepID=UPI00177DA878|nr:hypothetical protein [Sphingomonas sp. CFBP 8760]MBD8548038.1 hypothetical protein [Sphingomonas sp. CFBP 8760]